MHYGQIQFRSRNTLVTLGVLTLSLSPGISRADEPGIFGRIFRGGNGAAPAKANAPTPSSPGLSYGRPASTVMTTPPGSKFDGAPAPSPANGFVTDSVSTPQPDVSADQGTLPKLTPKSRVNKPITNAEPILTRFALGRSNDGSQFAMFLEVFADGTVLDSEGVHHVRQADLQPVMEAIQSSDFSRIRGHSGAPPTDFIDNVQIIVFDRRLGRLTAHPFSYSGNPQGTDHAVKHLHTALEGLQLKLSRPGPGQPVANSSPMVNPGITPVSGTMARPGPSTASNLPALTGSLPTVPASSVPLSTPPLPNPSVGPAVSATVAPGVLPLQRVSPR